MTKRTSSKSSAGQVNSQWKDNSAVMSMFGLANSYQTYYTVSNLLKQPANKKSRLK
jgi:hypothetical protein